MNSNYFENGRKHNKNRHAFSFTRVHPPGGLVAWPDGSTTRIGERRKKEPFVLEMYAGKSALAEWQEETSQPVRA